MEIYIFAVICFVYFLNNSMSVEARYCKFEFEGQQKYYVCPRNEYCCTLGCCISPTFQFYQLWYYWLMVIFMFVVCSGGQWWYRYWVNNNGYLTDLGSAMPGRGAPVGSLARDGAANRGRGVAPPRSARVAYHPATDAVVLHNIWKPPYPGRSNISSNSNNAGPPPSYSQTTQQVGSSTSSGPQTSPKPPTSYTQLYGPPPSYESVVGLSNLAEQPTAVHQPHQPSSQHFQPGTQQQHR
ncbi:uncharacterized protein [Rhodnius prolixus]